MFFHSGYIIEFLWLGVHINDHMTGPLQTHAELGQSLNTLICGETGLYTLQGVSYTAILWFTLVQGAYIDCHALYITAKQLCLESLQGQ